MTNAHPRRARSSPSAGASSSGRWRSIADSDFFALGGTSLAVAKLVSVLRAEHPAIAVADVYEHRTLRELAARLESVGAIDTDAKPEFSFGAMRRLGLMQLVGVFVLFADPVGPVAARGARLRRSREHRHAARRLALARRGLGTAREPAGAHRAPVRLHARPLARPSARPLLAVLVARRAVVVRRPARRGDPVPTASAGTPWADRYARLVGADVGEGARLATVPPAGSLLHIGAGATVESNVDLRGWWIDGQELVVGEIRIGAGARIGSRTLLNPGAVIGDGAEIEMGTVVSGEIPCRRALGRRPRPSHRSGR